MGKNIFPWEERVRIKEEESTEQSRPLFQTIQSQPVKRTNWIIDAAKEQNGSKIGQNSIKNENKNTTK